MTPLNSKGELTGSRAFLGCPKVQSKVPNTGFVRKNVSIKFYSIPVMGERVTDLQKVVELVKCVNLE